MLTYLLPTETAFAVGIRAEWGELFDAPVVLVAEVVAWRAPVDRGDQWVPVVMHQGSPWELGAHPWRVVANLGDVREMAGGLLGDNLTRRRLRDVPAGYDMFLERDSAWWADGVGRLDPDAVKVFERHHHGLGGWTAHPLRWSHRMSRWSAQAAHSARASTT